MWDALPAERQAPKLSQSAMLVGISAHRERDVVDIAFATTQDRDMWVDISQSASCRPWVTSKSLGGLRSMCSSSVYFSAKQDRLLLSKEHMSLLGFNIGSLSFQGLTAAGIRSLSGEAMAPPCVGLLVVICGILAPYMGGKGARI